MHSRIEKIKNHLQENKKVYIGTGVGLVVGAATTVVICKFRAQPADMQVNNKIQQILSYKPQATLEVYIEALGDPGNIIQDTTTGTIWASQNQTAKALGVNPARVSEHLAGKIPDINGHVLTKLGKASVA